MKCPDDDYRYIDPELYDYISKYLVRHYVKLPCEAL